MSICDNDLTTQSQENAKTQIIYHSLKNDLEWQIRYIDKSSAVVYAVYFKGCQDISKIIDLLLAYTVQTLDDITKFMLDNGSDIELIVVQLVDNETNSLSNFVRIEKGCLVRYDSTYFKDDIIYHKYLGSDNNFYLETKQVVPDILKQK